MKFLYREYSGKRGDWLEVFPSSPATVKFMTAKEFRKYTGGRTHTYYQGVDAGDRITFKIPFDGFWHAVVEKTTEGLTARCRYRLGEPEVDLLGSAAPLQPDAAEVVDGQLD